MERKITPYVLLSEVNMNQLSTHLPLAQPGNVLPSVLTVFTVSGCRLCAAMMFVYIHGPVALLITHLSVRCAACPKATCELLHCHVV